MKRLLLHLLLCGMIAGGMVYGAARALDIPQIDSETNALLDRAIEDAHEELAEFTRQVKEETEVQYDGEFLAWCECENASRDQRHEHIKRLAWWYKKSSLGSQYGRDPRRPAVHLEVGAGMLKHLFILSRCLRAVGVVHVHFLGVDPWYADEDWRQGGFFYTLWEKAQKGTCFTLELHAVTASVKEAYPFGKHFTSLSVVDMGPLAGSDPRDSTIHLRYANQHLPVTPRSIRNLYTLFAVRGSA
ncbi:hypothetical protein EBZ39_09945 [bacterium]|nr:hypothetical protein [bacterium]